MARRPIDLSIPDQTGKRVLLTGGSDGIGLLIAVRLAAAGAEVILPVRNPRKGQAALVTIAATVPNGKVSLRALDLSSLESVADLGRTLLSEGEPLHMFIGNAGVMTPPSRQTTADDFELQFGTNHLGHAALIGHLLPLLRAGHARVMLQISLAATRGAVNWDDPNWERSYDGMAAYSHSKIAYGLFGLELDRQSRAHGWGIQANLAHPGIVPTSLLDARPEIGRTAPVPSRKVIGALSRVGILGTAATAGLPAIMAATQPGDCGGEFFGPKGIGGLAGRPGRQALYSRLRSTDDARRMWDLTQTLTKVPIGVATDE